jgi:tight adherence protein B
MNLSTAHWPVIVAVLCCALALLIIGYVLVAPGPPGLAEHRRRPPDGGSLGTLQRATGAATSLIDRFWSRRGGSDAAAAVLEQAGIKASPTDFTLLVLVGMLVAAALGTVLGGLLLGILLAIPVPVLTKIIIGVRTQARRRAFADQLEDSLQLLASSLRAGHSMLQALNAVAREAEAPTSVEFTRVINEVRVGRSVAVALDETAERMESDDFVWVTQAIAINREVGGNLAEVLDGVAQTIRERGQIRRQIKALAAEGKLSAYVLVALPVGIIAFLALSNPGYLAPFTQSLIGHGLIVLAVIMMIIGGLWLRKVVSITF